MNGRELAQAMLGLREHIIALADCPAQDGSEAQQRADAIRFVEHEAERGREFIRRRLAAKFNVPSLD